ncbi:SgcJ/EcaC family oxidoreductase [Actinosynnema sp. CA-248983]
MTTTDEVSWGDAAEILAAAGVPDDPDYYGAFTSPAQKAVLTVPLRVQAAWAANDADAFADIFTENGSELIGDDQMTSREEIRAYMTAGFAGVFKGSRVRGWALSLKFLSDDVALLVTGGGVIFAGADDIAPEHELRSTWVILREAPGRLRLVAHQSSPIKG